MVEPAMDWRFGRRHLLGGLVALAARPSRDLLEKVAGSAPWAGKGTAEGSHHLPARLADRSLTAYVTRPDLRPPNIVLDTNKPGQAPGVIVTACYNGDGQHGPLLIGADGEPVYFDPLSEGEGSTRRAFNVRVQRYKGKPVLTYFDGVVVSGHGQGVYRILDDRYRLVKTVHAMNGLHGDLHEFLITPQDTALFTTYGLATGDLSSVGGSTRGQYFYCELQEVDIATNELVFSWRSDDHVAFSESFEPLTSGVWDYFHMNSINLDPSDGNLIISSRHCWCVYKVNRSTGEIIWRLRGKLSDFEIEPGAYFSWQHDVTPQPDGTFTIFDNGGPPTKNPSKALVIKVDQTHRVASLVRQYTHNPPLRSPALGSVQDLPGGHRFVGWGTTAYFSEYGASGELLLDGRLAGPGAIECYRAFKSVWEAIPSAPPAVVARRKGGGTLLHVSWNGASTVAHWQVHGGTSTHTLRRLKTAPKKGFETEIKLSTAPKFLRVDCLDGHGSVIGRSKTLKLS